MDSALDVVVAPNEEGQVEKVDKILLIQGELGAIKTIHNAADHT